MADATEQSLWHRMKYTPVGDALRGRISGRLDVEAQYRAANLPAPMEQLIRRVAKKTRLWRTEKVGVASELISHFADGIASGESADSLVESFGNEQTAAKLIRRAMKRNRTLAWHTIIFIRRMLMALLALYVLAGIYFYLGEPTVKVNYVAAMNEAVEAVPEEQRGWPLYRQAIPALRHDSTVKNDETGLALHLLDARPSDARWPELIEWLGQRQMEIQLLHEAAAKPALGFIYGPRGSINDPKLWPTTSDPSDESNPVLISILIPYLNDLRQAANVLAADARVATHQGDAARLIADIHAIRGIADQLQPGSFLIEQLVSLGIREKAVEALAESLAENRTLLSESQLQRLSHVLAEPDSVDEFFALKQERWLFYDLLQRAYTDDGEGDGRLTPAGTELLERTLTLRPHGYDKHDPLWIASAPLLSMSASRSEVLAVYDRWMDRVEQNLHLPAREADFKAIVEEYQEFTESLIDRHRFATVLRMFPSMDGLHRSAEQYLGQRDGVLIAIAAEIHSRRHDNRWPESLAEVSPMLLPALPVDRITGQPLHYRIANGKPLIYSVGADRDDDGGRVPLNRHGNLEPQGAATWRDLPARDLPDGDWVLFPPVQGN